MEVLNQRNVRELGKGILSGLSILAWLIHIALYFPTSPGLNVVGTHTHQPNFQYPLMPFLPLAVQESIPLCDHEVHHCINCCSVPPCTPQCSVFFLGDCHHWDLIRVGDNDIPLLM